MSEAIKKVSIITVNFNQPLVTEQLLHSIEQMNEYALTEIIVVDNGSTVNPVPAWQEKYPSIHFIRSEANTGFAGGNNIGIHAAGGDFLFLVNNDTEFTKGLVTQLVQALEAHKETAVVSPKIRYYDQPDMLQYAGYTKMNYYTARNSCIGQFEKDDGQFDHLTGETAFAHGAAMMVRKEAIIEAGPMKENYFLYYEEMDWCDSFKKKGYTIRLDMQALIYHKESVSVGQNSALKEYFMNRNRILFERRNAGFVQRTFFYFFFLFVVTPRNIVQYMRLGQTGFTRQLWRAIKWNLTYGVTSSETGYIP
ncbi:MAG: glycosyltransferase family 2 protein [Sediminibacterium sp.]|nr:glycosyltransferase family 2 protein [Sediminibacterium sp.]